MGFLRATRRPPPATRHPLRAGFTLVEILLALALVAAIVFLGWPVIQQAMEISRLRGASHDIRDELSSARLRAMSTGTILVFRFEPESSGYVVETLEDEIDLGDDGFEVFDLPGDSQGTRIEKQLPERITFHAIDLLEDERRDFLLPERQRDLSFAPPILFYPDGSTSTATLVLQNDDGRFVDVTLEGETGTVSSSDPYTAD